jgi:hypothetical protein
MDVCSPGKPMTVETKFVRLRQQFRWVRGSTACACAGWAAGTDTGFSLS